MKRRMLGIAVALCALTAMPALAQPSNLDDSLHGTRVGKDFWYGAANGGFEQFTGVSIESLGCKNCHGPMDADGNSYPDPYPGTDCVDCHPSADFFNLQTSQCYGCHGRQATEAMRLGFPDVHRDAGMVCWDCHGTEDIHGEETTYNSMLEPGAIDADCEDCHTPGSLPVEHADYDPHGGKLHCTSCHTKSVISCYNCHFESQVESHVKRAKQPINQFVMLVNREKDNKVHTATFQSLSYQGTGFVAFAPYTAHTTVKEGRTCGDCHGTSNPAVAAYNQTGHVDFADWDDDAKMLNWIRGVVPIVEDYQKTLRMEFITYDGDPSDPAGPSNNWSSIGKNTWDGSQLFFATPLTREQMDALGFATSIGLDVKPSSCENPFNSKARGVLPAVVYGLGDFDVESIDPSTLMLSGVPVLRWSYADVGAPGDCGTAMPDGFMDLVLKFSNLALSAALGPVDMGQEMAVALTGSFVGGDPLVGTDSLNAVGGGRSQRMRAENRSLRRIGRDME